MPTVTKVLRAAVYGRESKGKTKSIADQVRIGEATVAEQGWAHAGSYEDKTSASRFGTKVRGDWKRLRADLEHGDVDIVILWQSSRGSRTLVDWVRLLDLCRERGILLHIVSHDRTYDVRRANDYKALADDGVDASHHTDQSSEAILRGVATAAVEGKPHGRIPFGYERVYDPTTREFVEQRPHTQHAPIAREIITRVASNEPLRAIVRDLNGRGLKSPRGSRWGAETVKHIVRNPAYVKQRRHNGKTHDAVWPELISGAMWRAANAVLDTPGRKTNQPGGLRHLLSYIGTAPCGGHWAFRRGRYRCNGDGCTSIDQADADKVVTGYILFRLSQPNARKLYVPDDTASAAALDELAALKAKVKEARASFRRIDGKGISADSLAETEDELAPLIEDAKRRSQPAGASVAMLDMLDAAEFGAKHARLVWDGLPLPAQREIISDVCESIVLGPATGRLSRWASTDDRLTSADDRLKITPRGL